jgi:hypothetical protein
MKEPSLEAVSVDQLQQTVEAMHAYGATLAQIVPVRETFRGKLAWKGVVHVFRLDGHPEATWAYARSSPIAGSDNRRFYAVLHLGAIREPVDAVRAAIVTDHKPAKS